MASRIESSGATRECSEELKWGAFDSGSAAMGLVPERTGR